MALSLAKIQELVDNGYVTNVGVAKELYTTGDFTAPQSSQQGPSGAPINYKYTISGTTNITTPWSFTIDETEYPVTIEDGTFSVTLDELPTSMCLVPSTKKYSGNNGFKDSNEILSFTDFCSTNNLTSLDNMFANNKSITSLDLSDWDVSSVNSGSNMVQNCSNLTTINLSGWKFNADMISYLSATEVWNPLFGGSGLDNLTDIIVEGWPMAQIALCTAGRIFSNRAAYTYDSVNHKFHKS